MEMSSKVTVSYTYEHEKDFYMELLKPLLDTGCGYRIIDGAEYSHIYIPRKGSIDYQKLPQNNI